MIEAAVRCARMLIADALFLAIRYFWAGVRGAELGCREESGVLAQVFWLVNGWACREGSGVVAGAVVDADVVYRFGMAGRAGGLLAFSARNVIAAARFFAIVSILAWVRVVVVDDGGLGGVADIRATVCSIRSIRSSKVRRSWDNVEARLVTVLHS